MSQRRTKTVLVYMEPIVHSALIRLVNQENTSVSYSEYLRSLLIKDAKDRGFLTETMIAENLC